MVVSNCGKEKGGGVGGGGEGDDDCVPLSSGFRHKLLG